MTSASAASSTGLIHAHAGKTEIARAEDVNANGSSPLTRGKHLQWVEGVYDLGLIPAHAGKT